MCVSAFWSGHSEQLRAMPESHYGIIRTNRCSTCACHANFCWLGSRCCIGAGVHTDLCAGVHDGGSLANGWCIERELDIGHLQQLGALRCDQVGAVTKASHTHTVCRPMIVLAEAKLMHVMTLACDESSPARSLQTRTDSACPRTVVELMGSV